MRLDFLGQMLLMPIPQTIYDQVERLVAKFKALPRVAALKHEIGAVNAEIDAAVYRLYDLSV